MASDDIQGTIVDESGTAIEGATVALIPNNGSDGDDVLYTTTDSNGDFIFDAHPQGDGTTKEWHVVAQYQDGGGEYNTFSKPYVSAALPQGGLLPDSVAERDPDDGSFTGNSDNGVRIQTEVEWPQIGAEISSNASGITNAYVYRVDDGVLMGSTNFAAKSGGDTFTIDLDNNLQPYDGTLNTTYNFVADNGGSDYTLGVDSSPSFNYQSPDGNITIVEGAGGPSGTVSGPYNLIRVGDVGFS